MILERTPYYAYAELDALLPSWQRWFLTRPKRILRLLFRLANWQHPDSILLCNTSAPVYAALQKAVPSARMMGQPATPVQLIVLGADREDEYTLSSHQFFDLAQEQAMFVVDNLHRSPTLWKQLKTHPRTTLTFDLYDLGIALLDRPLHRMDYVVSF